MEQEFLTSGQAAQLLGIPARTVRRYLAIGKIPGTQDRVTCRWKVLRRDISSMMKRRANHSRSSLRHIIIINGEPTIASFAKGALEQRFSATVQVCPNSCNALIHIGAKSPDVVVLHTMMSPINPENMIKAIRSDTDYCKTRLLVVCNDADEIDEIKMLGADCAITKPFDYDQLMKEVDGLLTMNSENLANE